MNAHTIFSASGLVIACVLSISTTAQQLQHPVAINGPQGPMPAPDSRAWTDPALNHNKLLQQQTNDGTYKLIGNYKVIGSPFLFGINHKGDMFAPEAKAYNITLSFNTYSQEVEFFSTANMTQSLVKEPGTLDSFIIHQNNEIEITSPMKFIYGPHLGTKDKIYYMELYSGSRFSLYKRYKSDLDYAPSNLGQSELREFALHIDYYYHDREGKGLKKLKPGAINIIREFKSVKDLSGTISDNDFTNNPEGGMKKAFRALDNH